MRRMRFAGLSGLLALSLLLSCTDGESPLGNGAGFEATLTVSPVLPAAAAAAPEPIVSIRAALLDPNTLLPIQDPTSETVDPAASQWQFDIRVPLGDQGEITVVLDLELVNASGQVEWSARVGPFTVARGLATEIREVLFGRGPLSHLAVSSLSLSGPSSVLVGQTFGIVAIVETVDGSSPQIFWTSLTPQIADIDDQGNGVGLSAGMARIQAEVGVFSEIWSFEVSDEPLPDLVPSGLSFSPGAPTSEDAVDIGGTIGNEGNLPASSIGWQILVDGSAVASGSLSSLSPGSSANVQASGVGPFDVGDHTVDLVVDGSSAIRESDENNNSTSATLTVSPVPRPDLVPTSIVVSPESPTSNDQLTVTVVIENQGDLGASDVIWKMFLDGELVFVSDPPESFIGPGSAVSRSVTGGPLSAGEHVFEFLVDADESISESNEENNSLSVTVTVTQAAVTTGGLAGRVVSGLTGEPEVGVTVEVSGTTGESMSTDSNGAYLFGELPTGTYDVEVRRSGYVTARYIGAVVMPGVVRTLETLVLVPDISSPGTASGMVIDASTTEGIPGAAVELRSGVNAFGGEPIVTLVTDSSGNYVFSGLDAGLYTIYVMASGFVNGSRTITVLGGTTTTGQDLPLSSTSGGSETLVRVILTWGLTPTDLDAHLTGPNPDGSTRFHTWFADPGNLAAEPFSQLDVDDVSSFGPETITFESDREGVFRYSVHDFTNSFSTTSNALGNSGAKVEVFRGSSLQRTFFVPSGAGTLWTVFEYQDGEITVIDALSFESNSGAIPVSGDTQDDARVIFDGVRRGKKGG